MNNLILKELELYNKIYEINKELKKSFNSDEVDFGQIEKLMELREKCIIEIKILDEKLDNVWNNWDEYKSKINKNILKTIREILIKNKSLEQEIIELFRKNLEKTKIKLKNCDRGKKALSGYKQAKVNIPLFKSFKI